MTVNENAMDDIELDLAGDDGAFFIKADGKRVAELRIGVRDNILTAYHTEVAKELRGKGVAPKLFDALVSYARSRRLKLVARCSFVAAQLARHPARYADIWLKEA